MATGDASDFASRIRAVMPTGWFPSVAPNLTGVLTGLGSAWSSVYQQITFTAAQTRIATATGAWLDGAGYDYFAGRLPRLINETDALYSVRLRANLLAPKNTRAAIIAALTALTGRAPAVFEPANAGDTGGWDSGGIGWDVAGGWGETDLPFQFFVTAHHATGGGIAGASGWDCYGGGWDAGALEWTDDSMIIGRVTDADIQAAINQAKPAATIAWMQIV